MAGSRHTVQRGLVLDAVKQLSHPTAEDVHNLVARDHPHVSKATVYRNLNLLADKGEIRRVQLMDAAVQFDCRLDSHFHAQCLKCGQVLDVPMEPFHKEMENLLLKQGFHCMEQEVLVRGICAQCGLNHRAGTED